MENLDLYDVLDYILNQAGSAELGAIRAALRRRESAGDSTGVAGTGAQGLNLRNLARTTAEQIQGQVGVSRDEIRGMVQRMVRSVITREAPELDESQVEELLSGMIDGEARSTAGAGATKAVPSPGGGGSGGLPRDALLSMIEQFVAYSTGSMPVHEEMALTEQIDQWHKRYWSRFPQVVRRLISLFLTGAMNSKDFWRGIEDALDGSESGAGH